MPYKDKAKQREAQQKYDEKRKGTRHRGWVWVTYPESIDADWLEKLTNEGVPVFISPLHDKDVNADGTPKKPHNHYVALWDSPTSYESGKSISDAIGGVMPPKNPKPGDPKPWAQTVRGSLRYLCHLDNPEKAQYDPSEVVCVNATIDDYLELIRSASDDDETLDEMFDYIDANDVVSFAAFIRYCRADRPDWKRLAYHKYAALITRYIKSHAWEKYDDLADREQALLEREGQLLNAEREKAEREAGNFVLNTLESAVTRARETGRGGDQR